MVEPGAGTGRIVIPALAAGFRVTAIDISVPMLDVLRTRLETLPEVRKRCEIVIGDATALPFPDDAFDDPDLMAEWVQRALEAALRAPSSKR